MKNVALTGASGFIGISILDKLLATLDFPFFYPELTLS